LDRGRVCEDRSCRRWRCASDTAWLLQTPALLGRWKACNRRLGPALGKISLSPPAFPTKRQGNNPAHLNLFSWGRCLSVDRRRHPVSCWTGPKTSRPSRMPCPPQEKGLFCALFCGRLDKKCGVLRDATRGLDFPPTPRAPPESPQSAPPHAHPTFPGSVRPGPAGSGWFGPPPGSCPCGCRPGCWCLLRR